MNPTLTAPPPTAAPPPRGPVRPAACAGRPRRDRAGRSGYSVLARGEPLIWLTAGTLALSLAMIVGLLGLVFWNGGATFWPGRLLQVRMHGGRALLGEVTREERFRPSAEALATVPERAAAERARIEVSAAGGWARRQLLRTGNFELTGEHFNWIEDYAVERRSAPEWALVVERLSWGRFYGTPAGWELDGVRTASGAEAAWEFFGRHHGGARERWKLARKIETDEIGAVNAELERSRLALLEAEMAAGRSGERFRSAEAEFREREARAKEEFESLSRRIRELRSENDRYKLVLETADGRSAAIALEEVVRAFPANRLGFWGRLGVYLSRWGEFLSADPREANSEGGVFPAIVGTVLMTLIMSLVVVPFGVMAALYLREYAKPGPAVSAVRIAINNLAGVPSIVFGVFGLGFFCYGVGGFIDGGPQVPWTPGAWFVGTGVLALAVLGAVAASAAAAGRRGQPTSRQRLAGRAALGLWLAAAAVLAVLAVKTPFFHGLYRASLPNPTFGKGALIWASLTLALLTLPVVIVATEEALAAVPNSMREGSYACGGSKWQTIQRIVLPRALPGIMTGTILAMARGAGEVAPLMLVGAVKLAPELPVALTPPFGLNRSFMHLGFHIFDLGFQSQNSEAAKPMVYTTTVLLILIIAGLNVAAIWLRSRLRRKFVGTQF